jgi:hypothetical protein
VTCIEWSQDKVTLHLPDPRAVARQLHEQLALTTTPVDAVQIASVLGLRVEHDVAIGRHGKLDIIDGQLAAVLGTADRVSQRFALAHEIGHYLLYTQHRVPFRQQTTRADVEAFCDAFAGHLLVPDSALINIRGSWSKTDRTTLRAIAEVAARTDTPLAATSRIYLEAACWPGVVLVWRQNRDRDWMVTAAVGEARAVYGGTPQTNGRLNHAACRDVSLVETEILRNGKAYRARMQTLRVGELVLTVLLQLRPARTSYSSLRPHVTGNRKVGNSVAKPDRPTLAQPSLSRPAAAALEAGGS